MTTPIRIRITTSRITEQTYIDVQAYAAAHGIGFNAAVNVLLRDALRADRAWLPPTPRAVDAGEIPGQRSE